MSQKVQQINNFCPPGNIGLLRIYWINLTIETDDEAKSHTLSKAAGNSFEKISRGSVRVSSKGIKRIEINRKQRHRQASEKQLHILFSSKKLW